VKWREFISLKHVKLLPDYMGSPSMLAQGIILLFWRCPVEISARTGIVLTEVVHGFPQSLQANSGAVF
jgi:hypothetical protein